ncbi:MAG: serine/threonine protein phosphatase [Planctomycetaceae bacterium]|nr:serine/threonine protein phosphatase [Planctomycetaceae bacterium]
MCLLRPEKVVSVCILWLVGLCVLAVTQSSLADEFPAAPEGTFSIVVIPDTQHYKLVSKEGEEPVWENPVFESYVDWTAANLTSQRIVFVSHVGDIVDLNEAPQWQVARDCMDRVHGRVPYGISVGNHDMQANGDSSLFQEFFPQSRYADFDWYGGSYAGVDGDPSVSGNNANSFQLFSAEGLRFVFLHLECNAPDDVLAWADSVLESHADRLAIVTSHMGLGPRDKPKESRDYFDAPKGRMTWTKRHQQRGNSPQQMWDKCFQNHANLLMTCCGDQSRSQALRQESQGVHGNTVHELLSDYGVNGMRVMRFVPRENEIQVRTWNPMTSEFCESTKIVADVEQHQFTLRAQLTTAE